MIDYINICGKPYKITYCRKAGDVSHDRRSALYGEIDCRTNSIRILNTGIPQDVVHAILHESGHGVASEETTIPTIPNWEDQLDRITLALGDDLERNGWMSDVWGVPGTEQVETLLDRPFAGNKEYGVEWFDDATEVDPESDEPTTEWISAVTKTIRLFRHERPRNRLLALLRAVIHCIIKEKRATAFEGNEIDRSIFCEAMAEMLIRNGLLRITDGVSTKDGET